MFSLPAIFNLIKTYKNVIFYVLIAVLLSYFIITYVHYKNLSESQKAKINELESKNAYLTVKNTNYEESFQQLKEATALHADELRKVEESNKLQAEETKKQIEILIRNRQKKTCEEALNGLRNPSW